MKRILYLNETAVYDMDTGACLKQEEKPMVFMPAPGIRSLSMLQLQDDPPGDTDHIALACETPVLPFLSNFPRYLIADMFFSVQ